MKVKRNSWHYRWLAYTSIMLKYASHYTVIDLYLRENNNSYVDAYEKITVMHNFIRKPTNFCQYWRNVLLYPVMTLILNLVLVSLLTWLTINNPATVGMVSLAMVIIILTFVALCVMLYGMETVSSKLKKVKEDETSFIGNLYSSYKNNVCKLMEYEKNDD